jgi:alkanesulfonate monooxygenase SsuD/methylene tetrahydromethanopterin reductase-like flavin-dependent oxidoreductase (luciferase family)
VVPPTESRPCPAWIGVGGNPQSVIRAARLGFSLALAIIGGPPARFAPYSQLFQRAVEKLGRAPLPVLVHSPGHVTATDEQAKAEFWPRWRDVITLMAAERGFAIPPRSRLTRKPGHTERCTSAHLRPSPTRSPRTSASWRPPGPTSSTACPA